MIFAFLPFEAVRGRPGLFTVFTRPYGCLSEGKNESKNFASIA